MSSHAGVDAVLLIGFGGPSQRDEIRPFLDTVLRGRPVSSERYEEVVRHYEAMGGHSPYNDLTMRQADALRAELRRQGVAMPVAVGMRNSEPGIASALSDLAGGGARRVLGFVMAAYRCEASWERYQDAVARARQKLGPDAPQVAYPAPWHSDAKFIEAMCARASAALSQLSRSECDRAEMIFTAHSVPVPMSEASGYAAQIAESARLVARKLGIDSWCVAFQSRSGGPRDPWLEPDVADSLRALQGRPAVVVPIGFLCDHVEVLYDLDVAAAAVARETGVTMIRAGTVGDHPAFIEMIAAITKATTSLRT